MILNTVNPDPAYVDLVSEMGDKVRANTATTIFIQRACRNEEIDLATQLLQSIKQKRWERGVALLNQNAIKVVRFNSFSEWCEAFEDKGGLHRSPAWLFQKITTELINPDSLQAAILIAQHMDPTELTAYCSRKGNRRGFLDIARGNVISQGPKWNDLVEALNNRSRDSSGENAPPKPMKNSKAALRLRLVRRTLDQKLPESAQLQARDGLAVLDRNGSHRAACEAAGLAHKKDSNVVFLSKDLDKVATRILFLLGKGRTAELIDKLKARL